MTFLVFSSASGGLIDPERLVAAAGDRPIEWFSPSNPSQGGAVCFSDLAVVSRLEHGDQQSLVFAGRVRLDRRDELRAQLAGDQTTDLIPASDADLCLRAYQKWGAGFVEHIHGDFAFVIYDNAKQELSCVRDRFGVRTVVWWRRGGEFWFAGSMQRLVEVPGVVAGSLDNVWIADFLRCGFCSDTARSVYTDVRRLSPAHILTQQGDICSESRYWSLNVRAPRFLGSAKQYEEEFHACLDAAIRDRLPPDRLGILMSGGLDSSTLAAKALELGNGQPEILARTWLVGGAADPEAEASKKVAKFLSIKQTFVDSEPLRLDPSWPEQSVKSPEPSLDIIRPAAHFADARAMRSQATHWFYGEGPDNALTFEWRMYLGWLVRNGQWQRLPAAAMSYLATKSLGDWKATLAAHLTNRTHRQDAAGSDLEWIRGNGSLDPADVSHGWRPKAHRGLRNPLWQSIFEGVDTEGDQVGIEWRHPFMDLRVVEFFLATPPIPWARHKRLIRQAMRGRLPEETLRRAKTPLYRNDLEEQLHRYLPALPVSGGAIEEFVDLSKLPDDPAANCDAYALTRLAVLSNWLEARDG